VILIKYSRPIGMFPATQFWVATPRLRTTALMEPRGSLPFHKSPPLVPVKSQMNPVHTLQPYLLFSKNLACTDSPDIQHSRSHVYFLLHVSFQKSHPSLSPCNIS
jgi:hypothetical protein